MPKVKKLPNLVTLLTTPKYKGASVVNWANPVVHRLLLLKSSWLNYTIGSAFDFLSENILHVKEEERREEGEMSFVCFQVELSALKGQPQPASQRDKYWNKKQIKKSIYANDDQCDQVGRFIPLWATFQSLQQQFILPKLPTFLGNCRQSLKIFHFSSEIIFGQFL